MEPLAKQIKSLELKLLHTDMRAHPSVIDELLDSVFEEINSNGKVTSRQSVVEWLLNKSTAQHWLLEDFRIKPLSNDMVVAIYRAVSPNRTGVTRNNSIRSSIWRRHGDQWKMVFHQATQRV